MARNHKLTAVIAGRRLVDAAEQDGALILRFHDGSAMTVTLGGNKPAVSPGQTIRAVRQRDRTLNLDFENGTTLGIETAEVTSCVMVRDKDGTLEYVD